LSLEHEYQTDAATKPPKIKYFFIQITFTLYIGKTIKLQIV
jgi:hypothetical protein